MNRVYIVIVNWNGWIDTIECLESLLNLDYTDVRIVVCDNGSTDESLVMLREWADKRFGRASGDWLEFGKDLDEKPVEDTSNAGFILIANDTNLGFGAGTNAALRYVQARGDSEYCWLLNNDTVVESGALSAMVERLVEKPDAGMCGSTLRYYENRSKIQALGGAIYYKWLGIAWHIGRTIDGAVSTDPELVENKMDYVVGASLLVRSSYVRDVGYLAEDYFLFFEELDWTCRGLGRYSLAYAPKSVVYHKVGRSVGTSSNPALKSVECDYYTLKNRIKFTGRYCSYCLPTVCFIILIEAVIRCMVGRWDLARTAFKVLSEGNRT